MILCPGGSPGIKAPILLAAALMPRKERRRMPRTDAGRGPALRREIQQLKQQSSEIILRMDELLRELEVIEARAGIGRAKK
jgi:hypothetical protein